MEFNENASKEKWTAFRFERWGLLVIVIVIVIGIGIASFLVRALKWYDNKREGGK